MTIAQALAAAAALGLERLDAQLLLLHVLHRDGAGRAWLLAHDHDTLDLTGLEAFMGLCRRRADGEPLAYIVGHKEFFGLRLAVDQRVLVPRPDTETLVDWALSVIGGLTRDGCVIAGLTRDADVIAGLTRDADVIAGLTRNPCLEADGAPPRIADRVRNDSLSVVDLGTGSGAVALAIKKHCPHANVEAVDASEGALDVAAANARALTLEVNFRKASWLTGSSGPYSLIVSNPPYVADSDTHLAALTHEPLAALASGPDGLDDIRSIITQAPLRLRPGGWLLLEHGWDQAAAVRQLLWAAGFRSVASRCDLSGIERCSGGQWLELG